MLNRIPPGYENKNLLEQIKNPKWVKIPLYNNWEDNGNGYIGAQCTKIGSHIFLQGLIKRTSGTAVTAGILPVGYRPKTIRYMAGNCVDKFVSAYIEPNGNINIINVNINQWVDLSGLHFFLNEI